MTPPNMEYCRSHADKLDELHDDVKEIAAYVPKIEVALERLVSVQETLRSFAEVHKELFRNQRQITEDVHTLSVTSTEHDARLTALEESRRGVLQIANPVIAALIVAILGALFALAVTHGIGGKP